MRLIDADALMKNWERDRGRMFDADYFIFTIEHAPTIDADVAPVRCGRWKDEFKEDAEAFVKHRYVCTVCGEWQTYGKTQYCPNCGAKMDEGGSDGTDD